MPPPPPPTRPRRSDAWQLLALPLLLLIGIPVVSLFVRLSPSDFLRNLNVEQVRQAVSLSILTSLCTVAVTILFGTPVAYLLYRPRQRWHGVLDTLVDLPTVLPPAVAGVALLMAFGRRGVLGPALEVLGLSIPFTTLAVILAQTFIAAPLYIRAAMLGFADIDCELKKAAAMDGASRWQVFRYIDLPIARNALLSGAVMTWARALGEFGATMIFAGNFPGRTQTMPLAIYMGFEIDLNVALTLAVILICFSFATLISVKALLRTTAAAPDWD